MTTEAVTSTNLHRFQPGNTASQGHKTNDRSVIVKLRRALEERGDEVVTLILDKMIEGDHRYLETGMAYAYGKPMQVQANLNVTALWSEMAPGAPQLPDSLQHLLPMADEPADPA